MKWRALPKRHPPRDQGQSTGPFYVKIKIPHIPSHYSLAFLKSEDKILLDIQVGILGQKHAPKIRKKS